MTQRHRHNSARKRASQQVRRRELRLESLESRQLLAGVELLGNLNSTPFHSNPNQLVSVGTETYFTATTATGSTALWKTNGTNAGTQIVKDFADPVRQPRSLTNVDGQLFFSNYDAGGYELWKSDGTAAGTVRVKDIYADASGSYPQELTAVGSTLFFRAFDTGGGELWKSDGTEAGTVRVRDIIVGGGSSEPQNLTNVGGTLYFSATTATYGRELWKSGGSAATTNLVKNIAAGTADSQPAELANVNGTLYFAATDAAGRELWKTTATSAARVRDIFVGGGDSSPAEITPVGNGIFYFSAADAAGGRELWKSNGTSVGTNRVADISLGSNSSYPVELTNVSGTLFFAAAAQPGVGELWLTTGDGVAETGEFFVNPSNLANVSGKLMFTGLDAAGGRELWKAAVGGATTFVKDIYPDSTGSYPDYFTNMNGTLLFAATDNVRGRELWRSDGTLEGTSAIKDLLPGGESSHPANLVNVNGTLYFTAAEPSTGYELWKTDGTQAGTMLVADIYLGPLGSSPTSLVNVGGTLFFAATDPDGGCELWKTNGTAAGTVQVKDLATGLSSSGLPRSSSPTELTNVGGKLLFAAETADGIELWKSDGTANGTVLLKDIFPGSTSGVANSSNPSELINVNGTLYFRARDAAGQELWKSNGTAAGTVMVRDIYAGAASSFPTRLTNVSGTLMFAATDSRGVELWKSTSSGTFQVKDIVSGSGSSVPLYLTNVAGTLFFSAKTSANGRELWKSNGTVAGTVLVKDVAAGPTNSYPTELINVGGTLFFGATTAAGGLELWKSDGTSAGTVQVKDIYAGTTGSNLTDLFNVNGILFFSAKDTTTGYELWKSDGTASGTVRVANLAGGNASSHPTNFGQANSTLFMAATGLQGEELYFLPPLPNTAPVLNATPVPTLGAMNEDAANPGGVLVQNLVNSTQTDADANALKGIAVVSASTTNGTWQYSLDGGTSWRAMGNISSTGARLLPTSARVRFIPKANYNGPAFLGYRAWDRTQGTPGSLFDVTHNLGGSNAFSLAQKSARLTVNPINDAPVLDQPTPNLPELTEDTLTSENDGALVKDLVAGAITDPDVGDPQGIAIVGAGSTTTEGNWQFSLDDGETWQPVGNPDASTARLLAADDLTRIRFLPATDFSGNALLSFRAWDQTQGEPGDEFNITQVGGSTAFSATTESVVQSVRSLNDAPSIDSAGDTKLNDYIYGGPNTGTLVKDMIDGITDPDPGALFGIAVNLAERSSIGTWQFTINNGFTWNDMIVSREDGNPATPDEDEEAVLLAADNFTRVRFVPNHQFVGQITLRYRAWDQTEGEAGTVFDCSTHLTVPPTEPSGDEHAFSTSEQEAKLDLKTSP